jgi:integrase
MDRKIEFLKLFRQFVKYYRNPVFPHEKKKPGTLRTYEVRYNNVAVFLESRGLLKLKAEEFSISIAKELYRYIVTNVGQNDYAVRACEMCRRVLTWGVNEEIIKANQIFMLKLKKTAKEPPKYLTADEVQRIETAVLPRPVLNRVRDLFIFQCYTGFDYGDVTSVTLSAIQTYAGKKYLIKPREKNGNLAILPYFKNARDIWERYSFRMPKYSNQKYNKYLKEIAALLGITTPIYSHIARNSFAMRMLNQEGYGMSHISRFLGHKTTATTERYYAYMGIEGIGVEVSRVALAGTSRLQIVQDRPDTWSGGLVAVRIRKKKKLNTSPPIQVVRSLFKPVAALPATA